MELICSICFMLFLITHFLLIACSLSNRLVLIRFGEELHENVNIESSGVVLINEFSIYSMKIKDLKLSNIKFFHFDCHPQLASWSKDLTEWLDWILEMFALWKSNFNLSQWRFISSLTEKIFQTGQCNI